jgi:hypothetical protein
MIPVVFRSPRSLRALNVSAVGFAIAAMTTAVALWIGGPAWRWAVIVGVPSLAVGMLWAAVLRLRRPVGDHGLRLGWVLSLPLAAANGGLACGLMFAWDMPGTAPFVGGFVVGATFGVLAWAPGLVAVLVLFGVPIARAQQLAQRGLAGEERGEVLVGITAAVLGCVAAAIVRSMHVAPRPPFAAALFCAFVVLAVACGGIAAVVALRREARRRRFVARVEAKEEPGLRIETRATGKMLVRVEPHVEHYRAAPLPDEELIALDRDGRAVRAMR